MWKKLSVVLLALIGVISVGYAYYNHQIVAVGNYHLSSETTVKLGEKGKLPNGTYGDMAKGDKVYIGTNHPTTGAPLSFLLLAKETFNTYKPDTSNADYAFDTSVPDVTGWFAMGNDVIDHVSFFSEFPTVRKLSTMNHGVVDNILTTNPLSLVASSVNRVNASISTKTRSILLPRNLAHVQGIFIQRARNAAIAQNTQEIMNQAVYAPSSFFVADSFTLQNRNGDNGLSNPMRGYNLGQKDLTFVSDYHDARCVTPLNNYNRLDLLYYTSTGVRSTNGDCVTGSSGGTCGPARAVRVSGEFDFSNVVFAAGTESGDNITTKVKNSTPILSSYSDIYDATANYDILKLRMLDDTGDYAISFADIKNLNATSISKTSNKSTIYFEADAKAGSNNGGINTVSALFFKNNALAYYVPLASANGNQHYRLDLTGFEPGDYQVALVNECYNESDVNPTVSSSLTDFHQLTITEALSNLTFTPKNDLRVNSNVNVGDIVGTITSQNGAGRITYTLVADPTYPDEYQHLTLATDGATVIVKGDSLHAGVYHFKIQAVDENNEPMPPVEILAEISVSKTNLTVAFNDTNQTKKSITEAQAGWSETASATPSAGTKLTYSVKGGTIGLISIDSNSGSITYTGGNAYGKVEIKATADDDPTSGYDDYNPNETTKEIIIYREVDGSVTPHENSSSTTSPTFQTSDTNVKPNGVIGTIVGTLGTPDQVSSGNTTYTYGLKSVDDYNYFSVNPTTGEIKTIADLSSTINDYHITVTVSDQWSTKEIPVLISVGLAGAENLQFYENSTSNTVINTKTVNFTDTNVSVFATVKNSSNNNPVTYRIQDGSTNIITINSNSGAITITGTGTVTIVAEKQGANGQANAQTTLTFTVTAGAQNFIYTTDSTLSTERPKTGNNYAPLTETYEANKTFRVYTTGNPSGSIVTYQLKANSPTDVISVDSDGTIHILNASKNDQIGKVIMQATSHDPSGNYDDKTIELPITIEKGTRTITFSENPVYVINGSGSVTPNILVDGVLDTDNNAMIEVDSSQNSIAWTNDGQTIQYSWNDVNGKDIPLHVTKPADRNYKIAEGDGTLHILGADESALTLNTPGKIIYGDHFTIKSTQDDSGSNNVQYTFETDNQVFISVPQVNGNKAEFDALANSGSTTINVKVTRTADGELPMTKTVQIKVLPKPITIQIDNKDKQRLEDNPSLTFQDITSQLVSWNGVKDSIDTGHIRLSTTAVKYSPIGSYPITSGNAEKQLNDNYPNYTFTIKQGLLNVVDNGNKDFTDIDDDGCPDINIKITDDDGNEITINGDLNDDGIPDYNIDTNGDGKPDLNIDTDKDDKPDLNLVILKEWKPTKCVTLDDIQFSSGITAKAEINIDLDGDLIPDINIDNKGDFKPHLNISKDGKTSSVNITIIHDWKPGKDYKIGKLQYDSIGDEIKPELNIDTDDDGRPDINLDLDDDGKPDINIDWDGDLIPDTQIDTTGDGKADTNIDLDGNGVPDENIVDIKEWKPEHNVDKPFPYDTMKIESKTELEDNGITIEKPGGGTFSPSLELKVTDVTTNHKAEVQENAKDIMGDHLEVKQVFEIKLLENGKEIQPDGALRIKIPIAEGYKNAILVRQNEAGEYEKINATLEDGYLVYESDTLGIVSVIAETENEVQGNYYPGDNVGGAITGDVTDIIPFLVMLILSSAIITSLIYYCTGNKTYHR